MHPERACGIKECVEVLGRNVVLAVQRIAQDGAELAGCVIALKDPLRMLYGAAHGGHGVPVGIGAQQRERLVELRNARERRGRRDGHGILRQLSRRTGEEFQCVLRDELGRDIFGDVLGPTEGHVSTQLTRGLHDAVVVGRHDDATDRCALTAQVDGIGQQRPSAHHLQVLERNALDPPRACTMATARASDISDLSNRRATPAHRLRPRSRTPTRVDGG